MYVCVGGVGPVDQGREAGVAQPRRAVLGRREELRARRRRRRRRRRLQLYPLSPGP